MTRRDGRVLATVVLGAFFTALGSRVGATEPPPPLEARCNGCACPDDTVGDVIHAATGELHLALEDLVIRGRGLDFSWTRHYRSRSAAQSTLGRGWDFSYDQRLELVGADPGEARSLRWENKTRLVWDAPIDRGGSPEALRYCTQRSTAAGSFPAHGVLVETDGVDLVTVDPAAPAPGAALFYLVSARSGEHGGPLGFASSGAPRQGLSCGTPGLPDVQLSEGDGRITQYRLQPDGTWVAPDVFRVLSRNPDGSFVLTSSDLTRWHFLAIDGAPAAGRLARIEDRNGNALNFSYDPLGRLAAVIDALGRPIVLAYDQGGRLESVTDFTGRQVRYAYYTGIEPGGSAGDLKSVTRPAVLGTPTGNDFPAGKTTVYTYATGHADDALNHNLLTITDPRGQTFLENVYSTGGGPGSLDYDRVVRQTWGYAGETIDLVRVATTPDPGNGGAVLETIVNDRAGNVDELFFDAQNRLVLRREYTGRADPSMPTTAVSNRPGPPLRIGDPPYFETRWSYNAGSQVVQVVDPNQDIQSFVYDSSAPDPRLRGNILTRCRIPGPLGGAQAQICESFEHAPGWGDTCLGAFATRHLDGRSNETLHTYDARGNLLHTQHRLPWIAEEFEYNAFGQLTAHVYPDGGTGHRRRDELVYHAGGSQNGYLAQKVIDAGGLSLTASYETDTVGNVVREIDARGHDRLLTYNQLDQIVQTASPVAQAGVRYERRTWYDAADRIVRVDIQNIDEDGVLQPNAELTTVIEHDVLGHPVRTCREVGAYTGAIPGPPNAPTCALLPASEFATTEQAYDANRNRILERFGEAVEGRQPANVAATEFDALDRPFRIVRAPGHSAQSTTQLDYDGNGNLLRRSEGLEDGAPRITTRTFDGYDRLVAEVDPMGNVETRLYDANGNVLRERHDGQIIDLPGGANNVRLSETNFVYDAMDRRTREDRAFFDPQSQAPIGDGVATIQSSYTDESRLSQSVDDNGHATDLEYDGAGRPWRVTDAAGNVVTRTYDPNGNLVGETTTERSDVGAADQSFTAQFVYDALDRLVRTIDAAGNVTDAGHDSRNNRTRVSDARRPNPGSPGNVTRFQYDGLDRPTGSVRTLTSDGTGSGSPVGTIVTSRAWDDSSRLVEVRDGAGNATHSTYDPLGRRTSETAADGTTTARVWDVHDNPCVASDAVGSSSACVYDLLDRLTSKSIARASIASGHSVDVLGTTQETYRYDGLSRIVTAIDNDSNVTRRYDSLSNLTRETINGKTVLSLFDGAGNETRTTYPGGLVVTRTYDALNREKSVSDPFGVIGSQDFIGPERVERRQYANGQETTYEYDGAAFGAAALGDGEPGGESGDAGVKRIVESLHRDSENGAIVDHRAYAWDAMSEKTRMTRLAPGPILDRALSYDSAGRMTRAGENGGATDYLLDGAGNRTFVLGGPNPGPYTMSALLPEPADAQVNQYTTTPIDARTYDENGNLIAIERPGGEATHAYDYRNQLVHAAVPATGASVDHVYDALGRRIATTTASPAPQTTRYSYDARGVCEEQNGAGAFLASYVAMAGGPDDGADRLVRMRRGPTDYYYHADDMGSTVAITGAEGAVVERYEYGDFGEPRFYDGTGLPIGGSAIDNPYLFAGMRYEPLGEEARGYYLDAGLDFDPEVGGTLERNPLACMNVDTNDPESRKTEARKRPWSPPSFYGDEHVKTLEWIHRMQEIYKKRFLPPLPSEAPEWMCEYVWEQIEGLSKIDRPDIETQETLAMLWQAWSDWCVEGFLKDKYGATNEPKNTTAPPQSIKVYSDSLDFGWSALQKKIHSLQDLADYIRESAAYGLIRRFEIVAHGVVSEDKNGKKTSTIECGKNTMDLDQLAKRLRGHTKRGDCEIILTVCEAGQDMDGLQRLADATGCVVKAYTEKINVWTEGAGANFVEVHPRSEHGPTAK